MILKFIFLSLILSFAFLVKRASGCPQYAFQRKHICDGCDFGQALSKAIDTNQSRNPRRQTNIETVFVPSANSSWRQEEARGQGVCKLETEVTCYDFRKSGGGQFTDYRQGTGRAVHNSSHGHYEKDLAGACNAHRGKWLPIKKE